MEQKKSFDLRSTIAAVITVLVLATAGAVTAILTDTRENILWLTIGSECVIALVLLSLISFAGGKWYVAHKNKMKFADTRQYMLTKKGKADQDTVTIAKRLRRVKWLIWIFVWAELILLAGCVFCFGTVGMWMSVLVGYWLFSAVYQKCFAMAQKPDFSEYASPDDYPELYRLAQSAADTVGVEGQLHIFILNDCNAGIRRFKKDVSLQLGSQLLSVLRPEELFQILLHEFAHLVGGSVVARFEDSRTYRFLMAECSGFEGKLFEKMLELPGVVAIFECETCRFACSEQAEKRADEMILEKGNPSAASAALCKTAMGELFDGEISDFLPESFYAPELPRTDVNTRICDVYRRAIEVRKDFWMELLKKELPRQMGSHPIFRQRYEALGSPAFTLTFPDENTAYWQDVRRAIGYVDSETVKNLEKDYEQKRRENYLEPLELVERYEASDGHLTAPEIPPLLRAYRDLVRFEDQEKLCDRLLSDEKLSEYETVAALYCKGSNLLARYDEAGIEMVYRAIELNHNYIEVGLETIGNFCHWMGLEKEIEVYRARALEMLQEKRDVFDQTCELSPSDKLVREDFDGDGRLPAMLDYMVEAGEGKLLEIFLVRKVVSDDYFASAFVLRLDYGLTDEEAGAIYDKIFHYLDNYPLDWNYALFTYNRQTEKAVMKVEGSCIYKRD